MTILGDSTVLERIGAEYVVGSKRELTSKEAATMTRLMTAFLKLVHTWRSHTMEKLPTHEVLEQDARGAGLKQMFNV